MDREFLTDLFASFGPVTIRPMFSGFGISVDGINFALALRAGLFFRADEQTIPQFEAEGSKPFSYQTSTRSVTVASYWQLPARLFDDTDDLSEWARAALAAAQRAALTKRAKARKLPAAKSSIKSKTQSKARPATAKSRTTKSANNQDLSRRRTKAKTARTAVRRQGAENSKPARS
jgi:DNA transformation protein